jgi:peptidyl-prolyl cis-trans isomerase C
MRRSTRILLLAAAVAIVVSACADTTVVATVDGAAIDEETVAALRNSYADGSSYNAEAYRIDLTNMIYLESQKIAAEEEFGLTGLDDPALLAAKIEDPTPEEAQIFASVSADPDRTAATQEAVAQQLVIRDAVAGELLKDEAYLAQLYANQPELVHEVCARHILVATINEADAVKERLEAGEDFATVADEVSLDTQSPGGQLPCPTPAADYVMDFSRASAVLPLGVISDPVQSEFGWHIIIVDERTGPETDQELIANPVPFVHRSVISEVWVPWVNEALQAATIEVASQVGTWSPASNGIVPPPTE